MSDLNDIVDCTDNKGYLWGSSSIHLVKNMMRSYDKTRWFQYIRGVESGGYVQNLVKSLYDPTKDPDIFTFIRFGRDDLTANCIKHKCTITEINGKRWLAQHIDQLNIIQLYKEDSSYLINLYTDNLSVDPSIVNSGLLQQFVDESMGIFND